MKETLCTDGCGREVNKMNARRVDDEKSGKNIQICQSCYYVRAMKDRAKKKVTT